MDREAIKGAAQWYAQLCSDEATDADRLNWSAWLQAHPEHGRAWQQVEALRGRLHALPTDLSATTLRIAAAHTSAVTRRAALKGVAIVLVGGTAVWTARRSTPVQARLADYRTAVGEQREVTLADGSTLMLNTASAVDVAFGADRRLLKLHAGEILIQTAKDTAAISRNFIVETAHGRIRALGTRFTVRTHEAFTEVAVLQDAVDIQAADTRQSLILNAGQQIRFDRDAIESPQTGTGMQSAWTRGLLVVADWPLADFTAELSRYRSGRVICDPAVAALRISGAFPIRDTDVALQAVERALPVKAVRRTRLWGAVSETRIEAR